MIKTGVRHGLAVGAVLVAALTPLHASAAVWYDGVHPVSFYVEKNAEPVITIASQMFSSDMKAVTDKAAKFTNKATDTNIYVVEMDKASKTVSKRLCTSGAFLLRH